MATIDFIESARALTEGLLNGVWQGLLLAAGVAILVQGIRIVGPSIRHLIWLAALAAVVAITVVTVWNRIAGPQAAAMPPPPGLVVTALADGSAAVAIPAETLAPNLDTVKESVAEPGFTLSVRHAEWLLVILLVVTAGAGLRVTRLVLGLARWSGVRRRAEPLPAELGGLLDGLPSEFLRRDAAIRVSDELAQPVTMGFLHPTILLPRSLAGSLTHLELQQILLHELAHVRRYDDWMNLVQRFLESIFYFNPAVVWIGRRLEVEREMACDEQVVAHLGSDSRYAAFLIRLAEAATPIREARYVTGVASSKSQLARRIEAILSGGGNMKKWHLALAIGGAAAVLSLPLVMTSAGPGVRIALADETVGAGYAGIEPVAAADAPGGTAADAGIRGTGDEIRSTAPVQEAGAGSSGASTVATRRVAAQALVSGRVTTSALAPLPGVTVTLEGTTIAALTNATGNYTIEIPSVTGRLVFSAAGYATQTVSIEGRSVINVVLESQTGTAGRFAASMGREAVVLDTLCTSCIRTDDVLFIIDGDEASVAEFQRIPATDIESISVLKDASGAVYGERAANGVVLVATKSRAERAEARNDSPVTRESMERASVIATLCRSCTDTYEVLYMIDGVAASAADFQRIQPDDIESISVLKDAAAAAYGERAAKGVVLVTTKR